MNVSTAKGTCFLKNQVSFISNFPGIYLIRRLEAEAKGENTRTANSRVETIGRHNITTKRPQTQSVFQDKATHKCGKRWCRHTNKVKSKIISKKFWMSEIR